jgi:hypothetical protein
LANSLISPATAFDAKKLPRTSSQASHDRHYNGAQNISTRKAITMTEVSLPVRRLSRRAKVALAVGVLVVVVFAAAASIIAVVSHRAPQKHAVSYSSQIVLPFSRLKMPVGVAVGC